MIEQISNIVEEIIIIDKGKLVLQSSSEKLQEKGYTISGSINSVDEYCIDYNIIKYDELAGMKICYILGEVNQDKLNDRLNITPMNLQKLFVKLTENDGNNYEI